MPILKKLTTSDRRAIQEHFLRLDTDSLYTRFFSQISPEFLLRYVEKMNFDINGYFGFWENEQLIGLGECSLDSEQAEVAFTVERHYQDRGLGNVLMQEVIRFAHFKGIYLLQMNCLSTNYKTLHLAQKHGLKTHTSYGETFAVIDTQKIMELDRLNRY